MITHSILWASILASAGVALVTTLLVEYLAKPWLEVRKDRILEKNQEQRHALKDLRRSAFLARRLYDFHSMETPDIGEHTTELLSALDGEAHKMVADLEEHTANAYEFKDVPEWMDEGWTEATAIIRGFALLFRAVNSLPENAWEQIDNAADKLDDYAKLLETSKLHFLRRRKLIREIESSPIFFGELRKASEGTP